MIYQSFYQSPIGVILIKANNDGILSIQLVLEKCDVINENEWTLLCKRELSEYFLGKRKHFSVPLLLNGTDFQVKVWKELQNISYGETVSYQGIANCINNPKAIRAVGRAIHNNPFFIVIPCHRVIGKNGNLTGFLYGLNVKEYLLNLEKLN